MNNNFWENLDKGFLALAPLAGVSDLPFRQICKEYGADVVYSEMASATALAFAPEKTLELVEFEDVERPYVVQLFGKDPEHFKVAAKLIEERISPDGIDINFGCPVPKVAKQTAGAELFKDIKLSKKIIEATINSTSLPVSIKTRTQAGPTHLLEFLDYMQNLDIKALMVHGRTLKQGFVGDVDYETIKRSRDYFGGILIANGGIVDKKSALKMQEKTGADGLGIARGAFGRPWIFSELKVNNYQSPEQKEIYKIILRHAELIVEKKTEKYLLEFRKHLCWYVNGMPNAKRLREEFVKVETLSDIKEIINKN
ncbi:tRNA dihydrouridine synthase DusB [Candidatus Parcubacteria bacterium]|nr:MAG: tRNA dihydrouridine synthase DusB [Candidatus Parcubacteria bacterium]